MILLIIRRRRNIEQPLKLVCAAMLLCVVYFSLEYVVLVCRSAGPAASCLSQIVIVNNNTVHLTQQMEYQSVYCTADMYVPAEH